MARKPDTTTLSPAAHHSNGEPDLPVHYLHTSPSPLFGLVSLMLALALLAIGTSRLKRAIPHETAITVAASGATATGSAPILTVAAETWTVNGQPVTDTDILFRLSALAAQSPVIIIEHPAGLSAKRLTRALETVNRAGFAQVGVRPAGTSDNSN